MFSFYLGLHSQAPCGRRKEAHDFRAFQPFKTAPGIKIKTRTLTFRAVKGRPTKYPVPYTAWTKVVRGIVRGRFRAGRDSGAPSHEGRCMTFPSVRQNSFIVSGFGAVALTAPLAAEVSIK